MKKNDLSTGIRAVINFIKPYKIQVAAVVLALLISSASVLAMSWGLRHFIDKGFSSQDKVMLNYSILYLIGLVLILALSTAARMFFITSIGEKVVADLRRAIHLHLLTLSPSFFETRKPGEILSRLTNDISILQSIVGGGVSVAMRNIVMFIGALSILLISNTKLTLIVLLAIPPVIVPIIVLGKKARKFTKIVQDKVADIIALSSEVIHNIKLIQAYTQEEHEKTKFEERLQDELLTSLVRVKARSLNTAIIMMLIFSSVIFVLWVGSRDVLDGEMTHGQLSSFIFLSVLCASSIANLMETLNNLQKAAGISQGLAEFLAIKPEITSSEDAIEISNFSDISIKFENVIFYYPSRLNRPAIDNMSLIIESNKVTALVGKSGAGKSTILNLLMRFYDVQSGTICFNDINIKDLKLDKLRDNFSYVSQEQMTFSGTIKNNILYGRLDASDEDVREAARLASALNFIEKLPDSFNTVIGERGIRLSGGQRQRISIARAFLKNPRILLLDEATSSLDHENEVRVQEAMAKLMQGRTCIVIAHRLSTIQNADRIILISDGKVAEEGSHLELMAKNGLYARLYGMSN